MTRPVGPLPVTARRFLLSAPCRRGKQKYLARIVRRFHRWLDLHGLALAELRPEDIEAFSRKPSRREVAPYSAYTYARQLKVYLLWLHHRSELSFDPQGLAIRKRLPPLPAPAQAFLEQPEFADCEAIIRRFYAWLETRGLSITAVQREHVAQFVTQPGTKHVSAATTFLLKRRLGSYLVRLYDSGELAFDPRTLGLKALRPLPSSALAFLRQAKGNSAGLTLVLRRFYLWLDHRRMLVSAVRPEDVERFFELPIKNKIRPRIGASYRRGLAAYLGWLYARNEIGFDPRCLKIHQRVELPEVALEYLRLLEPTHRPSTCSQHHAALQSFYDWLADARLELWRIDRSQIEHWLLSLNDRRLSAATRVHAILQLRSYLRWLFERGELKFDPELLLRRSDLPRLPSYLPRPLAPDVDRELQRRLECSDSPLWRALWLARHTGVRIGELADLEFDCIRTDVAGRAFLKVPLGKLANERLVPLTPRACSHIEWLQQCGVRPRDFLLDRPKARETLMLSLRREVAAAGEGLPDTARITPHRLRHTFATSLLGGGMSLVGIMRLLGHRDFRMTLRYAAVSQELVTREYFDALSTIADRYSAASRDPLAHADRFDPIKALNDVVLFVNSHVASGSDHAAPARALCKRLLRLESQLRALLPQEPT